MLSIDHYPHSILHGSFQGNHTLLWRNKEVTVAILQTCYFLLFKPLFIGQVSAIKLNCVIYKTD